MTYLSNGGSMKHIYIFLLISLFYINGYSQKPCPGMDSVSLSGKFYHTVLINKQCWLKENFGSSLYSWSESLALCPSGWHLPDTSEFSALVKSVNTSGCALFSIGIGCGNNSSGFSAILGGYNGTTYCSGPDKCTYFWSSRMYDAIGDAYDLYITKDGGTGISWNPPDYGFSVRCLSNTLFTDIGGSYKSGIPANYYLYDNYPNPFNPTTIINYQIPENGLVVLRVYNELGEEIKSLVNEFESAGIYNVNFDGTGLASGVYFYRLEAGNYIATKKFILVK